MKGHKVSTRKAYYTITAIRPLTDLLAERSGRDALQSSIDIYRTVTGINEG